MPDSRTFPAGGAAPEWKSWLEARLLVVGAVLVLAALISFFAWNWQRLPAGFRLALVQGLFALSVAGALWARVKGTRGAARAADAALTSACVLIGVFWAVFGQIYQTGADAWHLFALWSLCVLPWLAVGFSAPLWILWVSVSNLALFLWTVQESGSGSSWNSSLFGQDLWAPLAFSFCAWAACVSVSRKRDFSRWYERTAAVFTLLCATQSLGLYFLLNAARHRGTFPAAVSEWLGPAALGLILFRSLRSRDLFGLHALGLCGYFLLNCLLARMLENILLDEMTFSALLFVLANVGYTALLIRILPHPLPGSTGSTRGESQGQTEGTAGKEQKERGKERKERRASLGRTFLLGTGGVLSALFLVILFAALVFQGPEQEFTLLGGGIAALALSAFICRATSGAFGRMFGFSLSLAGLILALVGLGMTLDRTREIGEAAWYFAAAALCAAVYLAIPHPGTRFASAALAWFFAAWAVSIAFVPAGGVFETRTGSGADGSVFLRIWVALCALPLAMRAWKADLPRLLVPAGTAGLALVFVYQILSPLGGGDLFGSEWMQMLLYAVLSSSPLPSLSLVTWPLLPSWALPLLAFAAAAAVPRLRGAVRLSSTGRRYLSIAAGAAFLWLSPREGAAVILCLLVCRAGGEGWTLFEAALFAAFLAAALWFCPTGVLFALCLLLLGQLSSNRATTLAGWFWLAVFIVSWYYWTGLPFAQKSLALGASGALLLGAALLVRFRDSLPGRGGVSSVAESAGAEQSCTGPARTGPVPFPGAGSVSPSARPRTAAGLLLLPALLCLGAFNWAVADRERLLASGEEILLALAPVDPRSLMQGDYMELNYRLTDELRRAAPEWEGEESPPGQAYAILRRDERRVGELVEVRREPGELQPGEIALPFRTRDAEPRLAKSFLFEEGLDQLYAAAGYGIFRCTPQGKCLLTGLADGEGRPIRPQGAVYPDNLAPFPGFGESDLP